MEPGQAGWAARGLPNATVVERDRFDFRDDWSGDHLRLGTAAAVLPEGNF